LLKSADLGWGAHVDGLLDLGLQSLRRLQQQQQLAIVHLQQHARDLAGQIGADGLQARQLVSCAWATLEARSSCSGSVRGCGDTSLTTTLLVLATRVVSIGLLMSTGAKQACKL